MILCDFKDSDEPQVQIEASLDLLGQIDALQHKKEQVELDLTGVKWLLPCSALLLSSRLSEIRQVAGIPISVAPPKSPKVAKFLDEIGFPLGTKSKKPTHCPITHFTGGNLNKQISDVLEAIKPNLHDNFGAGVSYLIGELSDNIVDHSRFSYASLMAQYYPKKRFFDIGILDNGITIPGAFKEAGIAFKDDCDAIKKAMEGISTKEELRGDGTTARGWGLRTSKKVAIEGLNGEMHVYSGGGGVSINSRSKPQYVRLQKIPLKGTFIYMRLYVPKKRLNIHEYTQ